MKKLFLILSIICVLLAFAAGFYVTLYGGAIWFIAVPTVLAFVFLQLCKKERDKEWEQKKNGGRKKK